MPPLAQLSLDGLDVALHLLPALLEVAEELVSVAPILERLSDGLRVDQVDLVLLQRPQFVVRIVLQGFHDLDLGAELIGLEVVHDLLVVFGPRISGGKEDV